MLTENPFVMPKPQLYKTRNTQKFVVNDDANTVMTPIEQPIINYL